MKILYGGTELCDDEVRQTFHIDMKLAVISGASVAALVHVFTSVSGIVWPNFYYSTVHLSFFSPFWKDIGFVLTIFGLISIGLSCLMVLFLYHIVFGVRYLGILNEVEAFVFIGIGIWKNIHRFFSLDQDFVILRITR